MTHAVQRDRPRPVELFHALGRPVPPGEIWEQAFDYDQAPLERIAREGRLGAAVLGPALEEYCLDLRWVDTLQPDLLRHALPLLLEAWQSFLFDGSHQDVALALHSALSARPNILATTLDAQSAEIVRDFMAESILSRISGTVQLRVGSGSDIDRWLACLGSYGCIWPDAGRIFQEWGSTRYRGCSLSAVQYLSLLVYDDRENPVFADRVVAGGALPVPWEYASNGVGEHWLTENLASFREAMTLEYVAKWLDRAHRSLAGQPEAELAALVAEDMALQPYLVEGRLMDLSDHLASTAPSSDKYWRDATGSQR